MIDEIERVRQMICAEGLSLMERKDIRCLLYKAGVLLEWGRWEVEIPLIDFDSDWLVKIVPPGITGLVKFFITHKKINGSFVQVHLVCYKKDGGLHGPAGDACPSQWNIFPTGDCLESCCDMLDVEGLINTIRGSFEEQKKKNNGAENG